MSLDVVAGHPEPLQFLIPDYNARSLLLPG